MSNRPLAAALALADGIVEDDRPFASGPEDYRLPPDGTARSASAFVPDVAPATVTSTPYIPGDVSKLRRRAWLYGRHYIRRFPSVTIGRPGQGKSALAIYEVIDMSSARPILAGGNERQPTRSWYIGEDPRDELILRFDSACDFWKITPDDLGGRVFMNSTLELPPLKIVQQTGRGPALNEEVKHALQNKITENKIDVLILDPLVKFHGVPEGDNSAMEAVLRALSEVAFNTNCSVEITHHTRKPPSGITGAATVDDGRGATAIIGAVRSARMVNGMTKEEAERAGVAEGDRWRYFRVDSGKANMAPPEAAKWFQHVSHVLPCGESVGVVAPWQFPDAFAGFNANDLSKLQKLARTGAHRVDSRSPEWFGYAVADLINADAADKRDRLRISHMIKTWLKTKVLDIEVRQDESRKPRQYIIAGALSDDAE